MRSNQPSRCNTHNITRLHASTRFPSTLLSACSPTPSPPSQHSSHSPASSFSRCGCSGNAVSRSTNARFWKIAAPTATTTPVASPTATAFAAVPSAAVPSPTFLTTSPASTNSPTSSRNAKSAVQAKSKSAERPPWNVRPFGVVCNASRSESFLLVIADHLVQRAIEFVRRVILATRDFIAHSCDQIFTDRQVSQLAREVRLGRELHVVAIIARRALRLSKTRTPSRVAKTLGSLRCLRGLRPSHRLRIERTGNGSDVCHVSF